MISRSRLVGGAGGRGGRRDGLGRLDRLGLGGLDGLPLLDRRRCPTLLGGGELAAEVVVLPRESRQLGLDLVEELVDLAHVIALTEPDRSKALVAHVLRRQRHDLTLCS